MRHRLGATTQQGMSLRKNFSWAFTGRVVYAMSQWGIVVILAKIGTAAMLGRFGLALAITAPVFEFLNMNLRSLLATDVQNEYQLENYIGLRIANSLLSLLMIVVIILYIGYKLEVVLVVLLIGIAKTFEAVSDLLYGLMQKCERMDYVAKSSMLKGPLSLLCMGGLIYVTNSLIIGTLGLVAVWAGLLFLYDLPNARRLLKRIVKPSWDFYTLRTMAWVAMPLGVVAMLVSLNSNIPKYFIEEYHGEAMLGYYTAMAYILVAGTTVITALKQSAISRLAIYYLNNRAAFIRLIIKLCGIGLIVGLAGVCISLLFGRPLLRIFYGADYAEHVKVLVWLMIAGTSIYMYAFISAAMTAMRIIRIQAAVTAFSVFICLVAAHLLIPNYGQIGAAWALLAAAWSNLFLGIATISYRMLISR